MNPDGILSAFAEADGRDESLIAVYHSHPRSEAIPSETDQSVPDIEPAQLVISLADGAPRARAWRLHIPFIGQRGAIEVLLHVSDDGQPFLMSPPKFPWALMVGNTVQISYSRYGHAEHRTIQAKVIAHEGDGVRLETQKKIDPRSLPIERVKRVAVVDESDAAKRMRQKMVLLARHAGHLLAVGDFEEVSRVVEILAAAFPTTIEHYEPRRGK
jgi:hypothetical protein